MAIHSLTYQNVGNQQNNPQENLGKLLMQAEAIMALIMDEDFLNRPPSVVYSNLWLLSDLVTGAVQEFQQLPIM